MSGVGAVVVTMSLTMNAVSFWECFTNRGGNQARTDRVKNFFEFLGFDSIQSLVDLVVTQETILTSFGGGDFNQLPLADRLQFVRFMKEGFPQPVLGGVNPLSGGSAARVGGSGNAAAAGNDQDASNVNGKTGMITLVDLDGKECSGPNKKVMIEAMASLRAFRRLSVVERLPLIQGPGFEGMTVEKWWEIMNEKAVELTGNLSLVEGPWDTAALMRQVSNFPVFRDPSKRALFFHFTFSSTHIHELSLLDFWNGPASAAPKISNTTSSDHGFKNALCGCLRGFVLAMRFAFGSPWTSVASSIIGTLEKGYGEVFQLPDAFVLDKVQTVLAKFSQLVDREPGTPERVLHGADVMVKEFNNLCATVEFPQASSQAVSDWRANRLPHLVFSAPKEEASGTAGSSKLPGDSGRQTRSKRGNSNSANVRDPKKPKTEDPPGGSASIKQEPGVVSSESKEVVKGSEPAVKYICGFHLAGLCGVQGGKGGTMKCDTHPCSREHIGSLKDVTYAVAVASLSQLKGKWVKATMEALEKSSKESPSPFKDA